MELGRMNTKDVVGINSLSLVYDAYRKILPEGKQIMRERDLWSFGHYPLTRGSGFLVLHRRPMIDYFSYLLLNKMVSNKILCL